MGNLTANRTETRLNFTITSAHGQVTPKADLPVLLTGSYDSATSVYQTTGTITGGADTIDLQGSLLDDLGDPVSFQKVHMVHYRNRSSSGSNIVFRSAFPILGDSADTITLAPQAYNTYIDETGIAVTAGSGDKIYITGTTGKTYDVIIVGLKP